jgi:tRNA(fMet)-specific endonuclease VapC
MPVATTVINLFELECGAETDDERLRIRELLANMEVRVIDALVAVEAAAIDRELRRSGRRIETRDTLIAGFARSYNIPLVTRNKRHFERVDGLRIEGLDPA